MLIAVTVRVTARAEQVRLHSDPSAWPRLWLRQLASLHMSVLIPQWFNPRVVFLHVFGTMRMRFMEKGCNGSTGNIDETRKYYNASFLSTTEVPNICACAFVKL